LCTVPELLGNIVLFSDAMRYAPTCKYIIYGIPCIGLCVHYKHQNVRLKQIVLYTSFSFLCTDTTPSTIDHRPSWNNLLSNPIVNVQYNIIKLKPIGVKVYRYAVSQCISITYRPIKG